GRGVLAEYITGTVLGALSVAVPADAAAAGELARHAATLMEAARRLSDALAATRYEPLEGRTRSQWHP
ncbi:MAG: hypothetical protein ACT6R4_35810, partial [Variovorax sp.]